ncbi:MAG: hypothetical protein LBI61_01910 [Puniceicoccales bacterium]|jgi:hypothetical protein|nr:hypothetical protein [Puniceicoccales bacterium]
MDTGEIDYNGLKLLSAEVPPSRYLFCPEHAAKIISWQITMADGSVRDVLFSEMRGANDIESVGAKIFFNAKSMPISGFQNFDIEDLPFKKVESDENGIVFVPENASLPCIPKVSYRLSELYFHMEISLANSGTMPIYWRPAIHFFVNLPWTEEMPLEKHVVKCIAKKRLRLSDSIVVINSAKSSEKTSLDLLGDGAIGFSQLQDSKIWIGTSNEEEGLSFIFGNKTQRSILMIRKAESNGKAEVAFLWDTKADDSGELSNGDMRNHMVIAPGGTEIFSAEISTY